MITSQLDHVPALSAADIAQHTYRLQFQALLPFLVLLALDNLRQGLFLYTKWLAPMHDYGAVSGIGWGINTTLHAIAYLLFVVSLASPAIAMPAYALSLWLASRLVVYGILLILEVESYLVVNSRGVTSLDLLSFTFYDLSESISLKWLGLLLIPLLVYWLARKRCHGLRTICLIVPALLLIASLHPLLEREHRPLPALGITAAAVEGMQAEVLGIPAWTYTDSEIRGAEATYVRLPLLGVEREITLGMLPLVLLLNALWCVALFWLYPRLLALGVNNRHSCPSAC